MRFGAYSSTAWPTHAKNVQARVAEATGMRLAELADLRDRITALRRNLDQALERAETAGAGQFDQISDS